MTQHQTTTAQILGRTIAPVLPHKLTHAEQVLACQTQLETCFMIMNQKCTPQEIYEHAERELAKLRAMEMRTAKLPKHGIVRSD